MKILNNTQKAFVLICGITLFASCQKESATAKSYTAAEYEELSKVLDLPGEVFDYSIDDRFMSGGNTFIDPSFGSSGAQSLNEANHRATLGRVLFYDELLSRNGTVSCGSCHDQEAGFADNTVVSEGFDGETTVRNSLALGTSSVGLTNSYGGGTTFNGGENIAGFSWDERFHTMEEQTEAAITNADEMGMTMPDMVDRVQSLAYYDILFNKAFGESKITEDRILQSISEFVNAISSNDSKFDKSIVHSQNMSVSNSFPGFSSKENLGKELYNNACASCHSFEHNFTLVATANNGLDLNYEDNGKGDATGKISDMGVFKVPFLRNIELSAPYMHDGRFTTLEEVVDHYSTEIKNHNNLDHRLTDSQGNARRFNFTENQKSNLVAYLKTLTDMEMVADKKFADPFSN